MKCSTCKWWNRAKRATWSDIGYGEKSYTIEHAQCRRYAPARVASKSDALPERVWPHVNANDWCGDYSPSENENGHG